MELNSEQFNDQLAIIKDGFIEKLKQKVNDIEAIKNEIELNGCTKENLDILTQIVHKLSGGCGMFGLKDLSVIANSFEENLITLKSTNEELIIDNIKKRYIIDCINEILQSIKQISLVKN